MSNKTLLIIVAAGCLLLLLASQKGFPLLLVLPLIIPFFWHGRKE
jgi:hypothetical protein